MEDLAGSSSGRPQRPDDCPLPRKQFEAAYLVTQGLTRRETAAAMGIEERGVQSNLERAYRRLGVRNVAQATSVFFERGWHRSQVEGRVAAEREREAAGRISPFVLPYLDALDRHLLDGGDREALEDLKIASLGVARRSTPGRDRELFLDRVIEGLGLRRAA